MMGKQEIFIDMNIFGSMIFGIEINFRIFMNQSSGHLRIQRSEAEYMFAEYSLRTEEKNEPALGTDDST